MKADLAELERRLGEATGPDRELDVAIFLACGWTREQRDPAEHKRRGRGKDRKTWLYAPDGTRLNINQRGAFPAPSPTASIDAIAALVKSQLPGWWWSAGDCDREKHATLGPELWLELSTDTIDGFGATVPLALCVGLIRTLGAPHAEQ